MAKKLTLQEQGEQILKEAEKKGAKDNYFFITTFKRYQVQLQILEQLEQTIGESGPMITKEYVKGRENLYTNPAINEYNKTAQAANNTVQTLLKILASSEEKATAQKEGESVLEFVAKGKGF